MISNESHKRILDPEYSRSNTKAENIIPDSIAVSYASGRRNTEEKSVKSQLLLESILESHKDTIIFSVDTDYNYVHFNKAHWDSMKFAYNADIKTGINILDCISSGDDRRLIKENIDTALRGESNSYIQIFGDINRAYYESFFNPVLSKKNEIIGCTVLARNITTRIEAEQALKDSETKFREIINQINDVIIVFDKEAKVIIWNKGAEQTFGLKADEALNRNIIDIKIELTPPPDNDRASIEKVINGILTNETPELFNQIIDSEIINLDSGRRRNIQSMIFPVKLNSDNLFCMVIRDTTEIKRFEKELLRVSEEKDKFYSMIAQYLYTPFNVFNDFSRLMAEELDNLPIREIQKMAKMMSKSASNLYNLLDNLLQWTKLNQGKIPFEPQMTNLKQTCQDAVSILAPAGNSEEFKVNHFIEEGINVYADKFMLKTIIRNLVSCAMKFSNGDRKIDILAQETPSEVIISVWNNGIAINPDYIKTLFDSSQINSAIGAAEEKGTTLGLMVCKEFVEKHGGKIWIDSGNGKSNEYKFTLPLTDGKVTSRSKD
jgi:PAS domain S-box-containing protein